MDTVRTRTAAEYRAEMEKVFSHRRHPEKPIRFEGAVLTSVVPQITGALAECARHYTGKKPVIVSPDIRTGLTMGVPDPHAVGKDRLVDAAYAAANFPLPVVTVDLGTATTFNVVDENKVFRGGVICPGLSTGLRALGERCAQLPQVHLSSPKSAIGVDTEKCMLSGSVLGTAVLLDGITQRIEEELGRPATLVVTWSIMLLLTLFCIWLTHDLRVDHVTTRQTVAEFLVNTAQNFVDSNMGTRFSHYAPFVAAIFSLSLLSSLSGLLGVFSPTADLSTELAWAVLVFVLITATKIKTNGIGGYLKGYTQPIAVLTPFNIISEIATPISMAFRHFGNIVSGTVISTLIYAALGAASHALFGLLPGVVGDLLSQIPFLSVGIPAVFSLYFDWFSSFMQAFIFCMLTMMYIAAAAEAD